jgi:hypothetical protein
MVAEADDNGFPQQQGMSSTAKELFYLLFTLFISQFAP